MRILFESNKLIIEDDETTISRLERIHQNWPKLIEEYIHMIIRNRERQLDRIEVTNELRIRKEKK